MATEAAEIAQVSRQYMHNKALSFKSASLLSGFLVFKRSEIEKWAEKRDANMTEDVDQPALAG